MPKVRIRSGIELYYESHGTGTPMVLIAGTGTNLHPWSLYQVPYFSRHYRTIVYDHRGTGRSDKPDEPYSIAMLADDVAGLLDAVGIRERAHIVGHSMGGHVAQQFAIDYPDKVAGLVLADTGCGPFDGHDFDRGIPIDTCLTFVRVNGSVAERVKAIHYGELFFTPEFRRTQKKTLERIVALAVREPTPLKPYLRHIVARQNFAAAGRLDRIVAPTLILVGEEDVYAEGTGSFVKQCRYLHDRIRGSRFVMVPHARHGIFWEQPDFTNETINAFLREATAPASPRQRSARSRKGKGKEK